MLSSLLITFLAFVTLVPIAPVVLLMWFILRIFLFLLPSVVYYTFDDKLYSWYQRCVLLFFEPFVTKKIYFYGDHDYVKRKENVIYMMNHQSTVDWIICNMVIARQGGIGRLRYILFNTLKYIPLFGYYFYQHNFIFVNRDNFEAHKAVSTMDAIKNNYIPCWVVIYPEVDRFNPNKKKLIEDSSSFAKSKGLKPFNYHLTPRVRGMELLMNNLSSHLDAVYDVTVVFGDEDGNFLSKSKPMPSLFAYLTKPRTLHIHLQRCPIADIPSEHNELRQWLFSRFELKENLFADLERSISTGKQEPVSSKMVSAAFQKHLSISKVPNGFTELPRLRKRWLFTAFACLGGCTVLLLGICPYGSYIYAGTIAGSILFGIPYLWLAL